VRLLVTALQKKALIYGGALLLLWLLRPRPAAGRVTRTLDINADINDPLFGTAHDFALDPDMERLIKESNARIAAHDTANPEDDI
jgi:hypothetical protein